jgi:hypothetical protein
MYVFPICYQVDAQYSRVPAHILLIDLSSSENGCHLMRFTSGLPSRPQFLFNKSLNDRLASINKTKKEAKMSGIATILGWAGFITLVGMMIVYISRKWLRGKTN